MDRKTAEKLVKFVNDTWVQEDLNTYVDHRLDYLRSRLELVDNIRDMNLLQGAITELRRMKTLRDEVLGEAK